MEIYGVPQVPIPLQIEPEPRPGLQCLTQGQGGIGADIAPAVDDLAQPGIDPNPGARRMPSGSHRAAPGRICQRFMAHADVGVHNRHYDPGILLDEQDLEKWSRGDCCHPYGYFVN